MQLNPHEQLLMSMDKETIKHLHEHYIKEATKKGLPGALLSKKAVQARPTTSNDLDEELAALATPLRGSAKAKKSSLF